MKVWLSLHVGCIDTFCVQKLKQSPPFSVGSKIKQKILPFSREPARRLVLKWCQSIQDQILHQDIMLIFIKNLRMVPRKAAKLENSAENFIKMTFVIYSHKTGKFWKQNVFTGRCPGIARLQNNMWNFNSDIWTCHHAPFFAKKVEI